MERSINVYPVLGPQEAKSPIMLQRTPGLKLLANISNSPIRGIQQVNNFWYIVSGSNVYQLDQSLTVIQATGSLNTSGGVVSMAHNNNNQMAIVDGQNLYICTTGTLTPALTTITNFADSPFGVLPKPSSICFLNQYFIFSVTDSQEFHWSNLNDGTLWNTLDFDNATNSPDNLVAVATSNGYLYLLGTDNTEVWTNNPTQTAIGAVTISFPFNFTGTIIPYGLAGATAISNIHNGLAWLTSTVTTSPHIVFTQGAQEQILSTPGIEQLIGSYGNFNNAYAMVSSQSGNEFFILSFPNNNSTICYDFQTKMFHERLSYDRQTWRVSAISAFGPNVEIAGDRTTGDIFYLDKNTYDENGDPLVVERICPHYADKDQYNFCYSLVVEFQPGVGTATGQGKDPLAAIQCSTDYGNTWDAKRIVPMGKMGEYRHRAKWNRFGRGRDFIYWLTISDPVNVAIIKAIAEIEQGDN
jgi:hypothetical protein